MKNWRERFVQMMQGRYGGNDTLNKWLFGFFFILLLFSAIFQSRLLNYLALAVLVYYFFRVFSRNISHRSAENQKFLELTAPIQRFFRGKHHASKDKTHCIFHCPKCHQMVRVPKGHGKICITCPKCSTEFVKRS